MTQQTQIINQKQFTGTHMFLVVAGFFAVVIAVNIIMMVCASQSWTGLVVKNSYVASQHFNEGLARARQQREQGWSGQLAQEKDRLEFVLQNSKGEPLDALTVSARAGRPAHNQQDQAISFSRDFSQKKPGLFIVQNTLAPGGWLFEVVVSSNKGEQYREEFRINISKGQ